MIGKPIDYDKKYIDNHYLWNKSVLDNDIKRYLNLIEGKNVLDLGIGEGQNSINLSELGYNVTGVDYSKKALDVCKNKCSNIKLVHSDIRSFNIEQNKYDLIISRFVLHFLHKHDVYDIINDIKNNLKLGGLVYLSVFSTDDSSLIFKIGNSDYDILENNVFHKVVGDTYSSYFSKKEILELFSDFNTVLISDEYSLDLGHGEPHYHGFIKYVGQKV